MRVWSSRRATPSEGKGLHRIPREPPTNAPARSPSGFLLSVSAARGFLGLGAALLRLRQPDDEDQRQEQDPRNVEDVVGGEHECLLVDESIQHAVALLRTQPTGL